MEELVNADIRYSAEEISRQSMEGIAWVLLTAYSQQMCEERVGLKKGSLGKRNISELGNFQTTHIANNGKVCSEKNAEGVSQQPFDNEIMRAAQGLNQALQQKPKIEMGLYQ